MRLWKWFVYEASELVFASVWTAFLVFIGLAASWS